MKQWHAQFPPDEIVSKETVWFERGKKVDESEIVAGAFEVWEEVSKDDLEVQPPCEIGCLNRSIPGTTRRRLCRPGPRRPDTLASGARCDSDGKN